MGRFEADDFGYSWVSTEEAEEKPEDERYVYHPAKRYRGGETYVFQGQQSATSAGVCVGMICCCLTICLVIAGGILISYKQYKDSERELLAGSILLVLSAAACLCGCCMFCIGCSTDTLHTAAEVSADPYYKEIKVRFRRLNDRYEKGCLKEEESLSRARLDVVGHMKEVREATKKETKEKTENEKKNRAQLENRVKKDLAAGVSVKTIRQTYRPIVFFIVFEGDTVVSQLELLRKQVSLVVNLGKPGVDQCVISLTSPGGAVTQYGLAASQLVRIRKAGIHLVVCVDTMAASGGYMMASTADKICAAPFAVVGSIGVVTQIPNFQRFLNEHKVDAYLMTAGKHKRTIDIIGDVTEEGKAKLKEELDDIHIAFKDHVAFARPRLQETIEEIATGEHWLAVQAKEKGLVDSIMTSDEYLESVSEDFDIIEILEKKRRSPWAAWNTAAKSVKAAAEALQSTAEAPQKSPTPMAIV